MKTTIARLLLAAACLAPGLGRAAPPLDSHLNEQVVRIPLWTGIHRVELETTIFKPPGAGPFPVLLMNHGKAFGNPHLQERARYLAISREFVARGYAVVIPMRHGFALSTGTYDGEGCDLKRNGEDQADDVQGVLAAIVKQPWADPTRIVVAGQSHGGLTAIAFGARHFPGVRGVINFAGGLRKTGTQCNWQAALVDAFAGYGHKNSTPTLWFYGANDSYFSPELAARMLASYTGAGGNAKLVAFGPFKNDAHGMSASGDGVKIWWPQVEPFLASLDLPTAPTAALAVSEAPQRSDFAALGDVAAVPYLNDKGREGYRAFLEKSIPRVFALAPGGAWGWASEGDDPTQRALANCEKHSAQRCKLYAVDDYVVWKE